MAEPGVARDRAIDLVIFDCDGVLIDSEVLSARVLIESLATLGVRIDFAYVAENFLGRSFPVVAKIIRQTFALDLPADFEAGYRRDLLAVFETELSPTPGIAPLLPRLACPSCVATSSSPERAGRSLAVAGLAAHFGPHVFTASEVARGKPAPDLFLHVAARMGADPARCLVIEDSPPGLAAGLAAGMQVLRYSGGAHFAGRAKPPLPDPAIADFDNWSVFPTMAPQLVRRPE